MHAQGTHCKYELWDLYIHQRASCWYCGVHILYHGPTSHVDHVVPLSAGGLNSICNLAWACAKCDEEKSNSLPWEWVSPWSGDAA